MATSVEEFFKAVEVSQHPLIGGLTVSVRIDLDWPTTRQHWYLEVRQGAVEVCRKRRRADAVLHADGALFERLIRGEANAMTAALRGELVVRGDTRLLVLLDRLLPVAPQTGGAEP